MDYSEALKVVETYGVQMLTALNSNITAVAVGTKEGGPIAGARDFSVTAFVEKKLSYVELQNQGLDSFKTLYTNTVGRPPSLSEDIDVVESGSTFELYTGLAVPAVRRGKYSGNPPVLNAQKGFSALLVGIGITNPTHAYPNILGVGTLGFFLEDDNGLKYLVSNNHVIGRSNHAQSGEAVVQPGTLDLTGIELQLMPTLSDIETNLKVAEVTAVVNIQFITPTNIPVNTVDAALAQLTNSGRDLSGLNRLVYGGRILGIANPFQLDNTGAIQGSSRVYKVGRTTGYTEGVVTHIAGVASLAYNGNRAYFANQIVIQATPDNVGPFSDGGDSGGSVLNDRHQLVGLLFAGSANQTLANPINEVLNELRTASGISSLQVI